MIRIKPVLVPILVILLACLGQVSSAQSPTEFFVIGFIGPTADTPPELGPLPQKLADVSHGGFKTVVEFRAIQSIAQAQEYLDLAQAAGLLVVQNMPLCRAYASPYPLCQRNSVPVWSEAEWATFISTLATHTNLVAWYLPDEIRDFQAAANLSQWVHEYDLLDRPVFVNPGSFAQSDIDQFPAFTDLVWGVSYPELEGEPRALTTHMMRMDARACEGTSTKWGAILQFFDSARFPPYGTVGYPTARELRSDSYQAIIGGAKGLWYFSYEYGRGDELNDLWHEMITITNEIVGTGGLDEIILAPDVPQGIAKTIVSGPTYSPPAQGQVYDSIQFLQKWRGGDGTYLFAANIATDTVVTRFSNMWATTDTVKVLFEGRTISITQDSFTDTFAQDDVHIYFYAANQPAAPWKIYLPIVLRFPFRAD